MSCGKDRKEYAYSYNTTDACPPIVLRLYMLQSVRLYTCRSSGACWACSLLRAAFLASRSCRSRSSSALSSPESLGGSICGRQLCISAPSGSIQRRREGRSEREAHLLGVVSPERGSERADPLLVPVWIAVVQHRVHREEDVCGLTAIPGEGERTGARTRQGERVGLAVL